MDWTIVISVLVALLLWPLVVFAALAPLVLLAGRLVRRRLRRAMGQWTGGPASGWQMGCVEQCGRMWGEADLRSREAGAHS